MCVRFDVPAYYTVFGEPRIYRWSQHHCVLCNCLQCSISVHARFKSCCDRVICACTRHTGLTATVFSLSNADDASIILGKMSSFSCKCSGRIHSPRKCGIKCNHAVSARYTHKHTCMHSTLFFCVLYCARLYRSRSNFLRRVKVTHYRTNLQFTNVFFVFLDIAFSQVSCFFHAVP